MATNERSLAQAWLYRNDGCVFPCAIYEEDTSVGFLMLLEHRDVRELVLWRLMIAEAYKNHGIGTAVVQKVIEDARSTGAFDSVILFCEEANTAALRFYDRLGFIYNGEKDEDDRVLEYKL